MALLVVQVNALVDRAWCSGLGIDALSVVSLCTPLCAVITGLGTGLGVGATAVVSRYIGTRDCDGASGNALQALLFGFVFSVAFTPFMVFCVRSCSSSSDRRHHRMSYDYMI